MLRIESGQLTLPTIAAATYIDRSIYALACIMCGSDGSTALKFDGRSKPIR